MSESLRVIFEHTLAKVHSLKQDAARELKTLESAESRIAFLREHIVNLDGELIALSKKVSDAGLYFSNWDNVDTMPAQAKKFLAANEPTPVIAEVME